MIPYIHINFTQKIEVEAVYFGFSRIPTIEESKKVLYSLKNIGNADYLFDFIYLLILPENQTKFRQIDTNWYEFDSKPDKPDVFYIDVPALNYTYFHENFKEFENEIVQAFKCLDDLEVTVDIDGYLETVEEASDRYDNAL